MEDLDFRDLLEIAETAFRERHMPALLDALSKIAVSFGYYLNVKQDDVVFAYYDSNEHSLLVTLVLRTGFAVKVTADRERESNKISRVAIWCTSIE